MRRAGDGRWRLSIRSSPRARVHQQAHVQLQSRRLNQTTWIYAKYTFKIAAAGILLLTPISNIPLEIHCCTDAHVFAVYFYQVVCASPLLKKKKKLTHTIVIVFGVCCATDLICVRIRFRLTSFTFCSALVLVRLVFSWAISTVMKCPHFPRLPALRTRGQRRRDWVSLFPIYMFSMEYSIYLVICWCFQHISLNTCKVAKRNETKLCEARWLICIIPNKLYNLQVLYDT